MRTAVGMSSGFTVLGSIAGAGTGAGAGAAALPLPLALPAADVPLPVPAFGCASTALAINSEERETTDEVNRILFSSFSTRHTAGPSGLFPGCTIAGAISLWNDAVVTLRHTFLKVTADGFSGSNG
jgi:hypothetical protein